VLTCWLGQAAAARARSTLSAAGLGGFDTPSDAAEAVAMLTRWSRAQAALQQVPESEPPAHFDRRAARAILEQAGREGRTLLTEPESKALLQAYCIDAPETLVA